MIYTICSGILRLLYRLLFRIEAVGAENVPAQGAYCYAPTTSVIWTRRR